MGRGSILSVDERPRAYEPVTAWRLVAVVALVGANAFFVAAEFGLVAVRRTRIQELIEQGSRRAVRVGRALSELNLLLSGCQLGITFSSLGLGAIGEPVVAQLFEDAFRFLPSPMDTIATHSTALTISFMLITFLHVVLGELVPKNAAIATPESVALWVASPIRLFTLVFRPLIWAFNESANVVLKAFRVTPRPEFGTLHTPEELAIIIEESRLGGAIKQRQRDILTKTLEFPEKRAVEAMVPRTAVEAVSGDANLEEVLAVTERTGFSRLPVWMERPDEFIGVIHLKDMLRDAARDSGANARSAMREALLVPESLFLEDVLLRMRRERKHFAIVLDEFGSTSGILTLEDILEELVGEIRDEYDVRERDIHEVAGRMRVPGTMRPDELEGALGLALPEGEFETVAGFILERLGRLAKRGDEVTHGGWNLRVAAVKRRRILSVDVKRPPEILEPTDTDRE